MPDYPADAETEEASKRARRRRLRESYQIELTQGGDESILYVMKVLHSVNELGILLDTSFSWLSQEIQAARGMGYDVTLMENQMKDMDSQFEQSNYLAAVQIIEELSRELKEKNMEYFQNGSSMIISSVKRRIMEYEGIGVEVAPLKAMLQASISAMQAGNWMQAWLYIKVLNQAFQAVEQAVEAGSEARLDLKAVVESLPEPRWEVEMYVTQIRSTLKDIPLDDNNATIGILSNIKNRIMDAKGKGKNVDPAIEAFRRSEPELKNKDNLKALIWAKQANDELLMLNN
jgi:hypothetical protein